MKTAILSRNGIVLLAAAMIAGSLIGQPTQPVVIDADTANEVDDLFAVARGLVEPSWDVLALNATQWQASQWAVDQTMEESYRLNAVLLSYLGKGGEVASLRGAPSRLFDWGDKGRPSAASNFIVKAAQESDEEKLNVVVLGALTNVATALLQRPDIAERMRVYWLGSSYDFEEGFMRNIDFNSVMDIQAVDTVLRSPVELHILPVNVAAAMTLHWEEAQERLEGEHQVTDFLLHRWYNHMDGGRDRRTIWDLALVEAIIDPELAEQVTVTLSKDRSNREAHLYRRIDAAAMWERFYAAMDRLSNR